MMLLTMLHLHNATLLDEAAQGPEEQVPELFRHCYNRLKICWDSATQYHQVFMSPASVQEPRPSGGQVRVLHNLGLCEQMDGHQRNLELHLKAKPCLSAEYRRALQQSNMTDSVSMRISHKLWHWDNNFRLRAGSCSTRRQTSSPCP